MAKAKGKVPEIRVNRAPVLTLWAAVVAERLGYAWPDSLTLGKAVAGLNAQSKGRALGIYAAKPHAAAKGFERSGAKPEPTRVELLHRSVPVRRSAAGVRALLKEKPIAPESVEKYLRAKFKDDFDAVRVAFEDLARSRTKKALAEEAYALYESFRPSIPAGKRGWGAAGVLDLERVRALAEGGDG